MTDTELKELKKLKVELGKDLQWHNDTEVTKLIDSIDYLLKEYYPNVHALLIEEFSKDEDKTSVFMVRTIRALKVWFDNNTED